MNGNDPYTIIRNEVAAMLQLDVEHLTVRERMRLDLFATAKFEFDASVARLRAGGQVDPARLAEVVDMLDRMIDRYAPASSDEKVHQLGSSASRRRLEAKIAARIAAEEIEAGERKNERDEEREASRARIAELESENAQLRFGAVSFDDQTKLPRQLTPDELRAEQEKIAANHGRNVAPSYRADPPAHYLKRENPWDNHLDDDPNWMMCDRWGKIGSR